MEQPPFSNKHKHLEFVQAAVNRMAGNLFLLKGWSITLIAALFALAAKDANPKSGSYPVPGRVSGGLNSPIAGAILSLM